MPTFRLQGIAAVLCGIAVLALGPAKPANATVILGTSTAFGVSFSITYTPSTALATLLPAFTLAAGPFPSVGAVAPAPYALSDDALAVSISLPPSVPLVTLSATALPVNASSDVDGLPGNRFAHADAAAAKLGLGLGLTFPATPVSPPLTTTVLSIGFEGLSADANVLGDYGGLVSLGGTIVSGVLIAFPIFPTLGLISFAVSPPPNTELVAPGLGLPLSIVVNEQTLLGDGISSLSLEVTGLDINFGIPVIAGPVAFGILTGNIVVGHAYAELQAVPTVDEPGTLLLLCVFIAGYIGVSWRTRRFTRSFSPARPFPCGT